MKFKFDKHTPGPWIVLSSDKVSEPMICHENPADAVIMAAAPEMLYMLKKLQAYAEEYGQIDSLLKETGVTELLKRLPK